MSLITTFSTATEAVGVVAGAQSQHLFSPNSPLARLGQGRIKLVSLLLLLGLSSVSYAQVHVDTTAAQEIQRSQARAHQLRQQQEKTPDVRLPSPTLPISNAESHSNDYPDFEQPCLPISRITLTGESAERFQFALVPVTQGADKANRAIGRCLGIQGINVVLARVNQAIIERGYVTTKIVIAPQDQLKTGELLLTVVPGRIHAIRFAPMATGATRGNTWNALPMSAGDILNLRDIEQGLENFKRVPTAEANIDIEATPVAEVATQAEPSAMPSTLPTGASDLVVRYQQARPYRLALSADDSGSRSTGKYQGAFTFSLDNPLALNDLFYFTLNHDLGGGNATADYTNGHIVHYSLPFGYWLLGLTDSVNGYRQNIPGPDQTNAYSGTSHNDEIKLSRLVYRSSARKTTLSFKGFLSNSRNYINDEEVAVQRRRAAGWEGAVNHREYLGNVTLDSTLAYKRGTGAFGAIPAPAQDFGEETARFKLITAEVNLTAPFTVGTQKFTYTGTARGQWNRTTLTQQDRFSIGSRYTVRGFDGEMTLIGERGWFLRNDVGMPIGQSGVEIYLALDHGHVGGPASTVWATQRLTGFAWGVRGVFQKLNYDFFIGQPISKPDNFTTAGTVVGFNLNWSF